VIGYGESGTKQAGVIQGPQRAHSNANQASSIRQHTPHEHSYPVVTCLSPDKHSSDTTPKTAPDTHFNMVTLDRSNNHFVLAQHISR
jgi:hypothetical protein